MALGKLHLVVQDDDGNVVDGASITVTRESTGVLAVPRGNAAGSISLGNPYVAADGRDAGCYLIGGTYRIDAVKDGFSMTLRDMPAGTAQGADLPVGGYSSRIVTAAGDVDVETTDVTLIINKTVAAATNVLIPPAADRDGVPVIIKDGKRDADVNPITPVFDGSPSEYCDGLPGSAFMITTPGGWVRFDPLPDGSGYVCLGMEL